DEPCRSPARAGLSRRGASAADREAQPRRRRRPRARARPRPGDDRHLRRLGRRKLLPALYQLENAHGLPERFAVVGFARTAMSDDAYREATRAALAQAAGGEVAADHPLLRALHYQPGDVDDAASLGRLRARLDAIEREHGLPGNRLYYAAVAPHLFTPLVAGLAGAGLIHRPGAVPWSRVIVEKPFGRDLTSARALNATLTALLDESQIYRIDHYLGKE